MSEQILAHILFDFDAHSVADIDHVISGEHINELEHGEKHRHLQNHRQREL